MDEKQLVTIAKFMDIGQADIAQMKLKTEGIESFLDGFNTNLMKVVGDALTLQVKIGDAKLALKILSQFHIPHSFVGRDIETNKDSGKG